MALLGLAHSAAAEPIPDDPTAPSLPAYAGQPATARPLGDKAVEPHPFLAPQSTLHVDLYNSGVTDLAPPLGASPVVSSRAFGEVIGTCLNFTFDARDNLFAFCGVLTQDTIDFEVTWLDPDTLEKRSTYTLLSLTLAELAGLPIDLGYMFLDAEGRMIGIDRENRVKFIGLSDDASPELTVLEQWDLSSLVPPAVDHIATVVPDYEGHYWFLTLGSRDAAGSVTPARVGILQDPAQARADVLELDGEVVENGLAMGPDGTYVVSDHALYALERDPASGGVRVAWREPYERATRTKPGVISLGSGASPTLLGDRWVIITDNADEQIHLLVYDRTDTSENRLVCRVPLFEPGASANENSVVAHGRSIIVQNWYGAPETIIGGERKTTVPGLVRIDIRQDESGCDQIWYNQDIATPATVKLSSKTGVIYGTEVARDVEGVDAWYAFLVDFETGQTQNRVLLGTGAAKDILFSPTYFGPDGTFLQPVAAGIVWMKDGEGTRAPDAGRLDSGTLDASAPHAGGADVGSFRGGCSCSTPAHRDPSLPGAVLVSIAAAGRLRRRRGSGAGSCAGPRTASTLLDDCAARSR